MACCLRCDLTICICNTSSQLSIKCQKFGHYLYYSLLLTTEKQQNICLFFITLLTRYSSHVSGENVLLEPDRETQQTYLMQLRWRSVCREQVHGSGHDIRPSPSSFIILWFFSFTEDLNCGKTTNLNRKAQSLLQARKRKYTFIHSSCINQFCNVLCNVLGSVLA